MFIGTNYFLIWLDAIEIASFRLKNIVWLLLKAAVSWLSNHAHYLCDIVLGLCFNLHQQLLLVEKPAHGGGTNSIPLWAAWTWLKQAWHQLCCAQVFLKTFQQDFALRYASKISISALHLRLTKKKKRAEDLCPLSVKMLERTLLSDSSSDMNLPNAFC